MSHVINTVAFEPEVFFSCFITSLYLGTLLVVVNKYISQRSKIILVTAG